VKSSVMTMPEKALAVTSECELLTEEAQLIKRTLSGDRNAFGQIVTRYRESAVRVAASIVGDIDIAKDITQVAFIKAYRALGRFDIHAPFLPWFYKILKNSCRDHLRKKRRFSNMVERFRVKADKVPDMREEVQRQEIQEKVRAAVRSLSPKDREIIELKHFAGLSYSEMSKVLQIPKGTVMSRLFYARKALREILEQSSDMSWEVHHGM